MTLEQMLSIVRILSNSCFVRWWAHWNYPQRQPWFIGFCAIDENGTAVEIDRSGLHGSDYGYSEWAGKRVYIFRRLSEDGSAYTGGET